MKLNMTCKTKLCPQCSVPVHVKALVDSDDRTYLTWNYCEQCGWDARPAQRLRQRDYAEQIVFYPGKEP